MPVLRERARKTELLRRVPDETISDLRAAGLFKVLQPACYGGYEADMETYFDVVLTLSAADGSVGWVYTASPKFVEMWQKHSVRGFETSRKRFDQPQRGRVNPRLHPTG